MTGMVGEELEQLRQQGLYRVLRTVRGRQSARVELAGRDTLLLCSNNYLGLAEHPALARGAQQALESFGTSSGASRLVSGTMELHDRLEEALADFKRTEAALLFNSGYAANTGIIPVLVGKGDTVFSDRLNHASIIDGILLSGAKMIRYPHNDTAALERILEQRRGSGRCLIVTDGVFSMDGDIARYRELVGLKRRYDALLMVDDAHGCGVMGEEGRGSAAMCGVADAVDIHVGTFGKAFGSYGAYAALSAELRELMINRSRSFIFSTSLPPAVLGATLAALELIRSEAGDSLRARLQENTALFRKTLSQAGLTLQGATQIVPIIVGEAAMAMGLSEALLQEGIYVQGIRPPTVPKGSCRLRCTVMATHEPEELVRAAEAIVGIARRNGLL